jgi:UDP-glucose 4-epimerase
MTNLILLTGSSGFIGFNLLKHLEQDPTFEEVLGLSRGVSASGKLTSYEISTAHDYYLRLNEVELLIHAGAWIPKNAREANDTDLAMGNIESTKSLLSNQFTELKAIILLSTIDVYGTESSMAEDSIPKPLTSYAQSKFICEELVQEWAREKDVIVQILRIGHTYGQGEEKFAKMIPRNIRRVKLGINPQVYGDGKDERSYIHATEVSQAIAESCKLEMSAGPINIASANAYSTKYVAEQIIELSGSQRSIDYLQTAGKGMSITPPTTKMREIIAVQPIPFRQGLKDEIDNFDMNVCADDHS